METTEGREHAGGPMITGRRDANLLVLAESGHVQGIGETRWRQYDGVRERGLLLKAYGAA